MLTLHLRADPESQVSVNFDVIVYGATGFTGRQLAHELHAQVVEGLAPGVRIALAGRSAERLARVAEPLGLPVIVADALDRQAVAQMVAQGRVIASTAGPFSQYGDAVVDACVEQGVHYLDITGEVPWVHEVIQRHHTRAQSQGTLLIPCCGFDSVPSDLGTWWMVQQVKERLGQETIKVEAAFSIKGGFNGGTLASGLNLAERYPAKAMAHPFWLNPDPAAETHRWSAHADPRKPLRHPELGPVAPFLMGSVNTRVVRRSAALFALDGAHGRSYGPDFAYQEYARVASLAGGWVGTLGLGLVAQAMGSKGGRSLLRRFGPKPGAGPSEQQMDEGYVSVRYVATAADGRTLRGKLKAPGDPGNRVTVRILAQAALAVAEAEGLPGGVLTPAVGLGARLLQRLEATGKWAFELQD